MATVWDHLSGEELEERFVGCEDASASRHFQVIWLLARGHTISQVSGELEGICVKTMVLTSPNRLESDAATGKEKAERTPDQKKKRLAAESDGVESFE